jgi:hypothetical protein
MPDPLRCYRPPAIKPTPQSQDGSLHERLLALAEEVQDLEAMCRQRNEELASIRATLIVNFGEGMRHNIYGLAIKDEGSTHALLIQVLETLTKTYITPPDSAIRTPQSALE